MSRCYVISPCPKQSDESLLSWSGRQHVADKRRCHISNCKASRVYKEVSFFTMFLSVLWKCKPKEYFTMRYIFNVYILRQKMARQKFLARMAVGISLTNPAHIFSYVQFWSVNVVPRYWNLVTMSKDPGRAPVLWRCPALCSRQIDMHSTPSPGLR